MTIAGGAAPRHTADPGAREGFAAGPAPGHTADPGAREGFAAGPAPGHRPDIDPDIGTGPGPVPGAGQWRLNAPPFSWLGSDAWPNFALWQDKPS